MEVLFVIHTYNRAVIASLSAIGYYTTSSINN